VKAWGCDFSEITDNIRNFAAWFSFVSGSLGWVEASGS
jgi:hypothetical protein